MQGSTKGSLFSNRSASPYSHRRQRRNTRRFVSYLLEFFGDQLYYVGATIEREWKNVWRGFRRSAARFFRAVFRGFSIVFSAVGRTVSTVFHDLVNPFRKLFRSLRSLALVFKETKGKGFRARAARMRQFFQYGWIWNRHLVFRLLNYLLPAAAVAGFVFVVYQMLNLNFALAVNYNGRMVGYVANEQVYDSAQQIVKNRVIEAEGELDWTADASLSVAVAAKDALSSQANMADSLLRVSGGEIVEATGLYIGGVFCGATTSGDLLAAALDDLLLPYRQQVGDESTDVRFAEAVELVEGIYPEGSVVPYEQIEALIHSTDGGDVYRTVGEYEDAGDVAEAGGITEERLAALNPGVDLSDVSDGDRLLIAAARPRLAVQVVRIETETELVPIETERQYDQRFDAGYSVVLTEGQEGRKEVKYEIEYENGAEISRLAVEETVVTPMVKKVVIVGTQNAYNPNTGIRPVSGGELLWPTGVYQMISRGWRSYHQAIDIAAAANTPVYAAEGGTVIKADWTDTGYGNYIIIDHGNGMQTLYAHCNSLISAVGDYVSRGQQIAYVGSTGNSTGNHLHFEVRIGGVKVPTEPYLGLEMVW